MLKMIFQCFTTGIFSWLSRVKLNIIKADRNGLSLLVSLKFNEVLKDDFVIIAFLIFIVAIGLSEFVIMKLLAGDYFFSNPWLMALLDASILSLVGIITVHYIKERLIKNKKAVVESIILKVAAIIFISELIIMLLIDLFSQNIPLHIEELIDVVAVTLTAGGGVYLAILAPMYGSDDKIILSRAYLFNSMVYIGGIASILLLLMSAYKDNYQKVKGSILLKEKFSIEHLEADIQNKLYQPLLDALVLANQKNLTTLDNFSTIDQRSIEALSDDYKNLQTIKPQYYQVRFIDKSGKEVIRRDYINGKSVAKTNAKLQDKSERYYFKQGIQLNYGDVYLTPLDLNIENGKIEVPYKPVIRAVTPVFSNEKIGVLVINVEGDKLFEDAEQLNKNMVGELLIVNSEGFFVFSDNKEQLWGFMIQAHGQENLSYKQPSLWSDIVANKQGVFHTEEHIYVYQKFASQLDKYNRLLSGHISVGQRTVNWPGWIVISKISKNIINDELSKQRNFMIFFFILVGGGLTIGMILFRQANKKRNIAERKVKHLALYDSLTNLANRALFADRLKLHLREIERLNKNLGLMYLDLDKFKPVNDQFGHQVGDEVLKVVSSRIVSCVRKTDTVARLGGDEFAILLPNFGCKENLIELSERIIEEVSKKIIIGEQVCQLGISIGISYTDNAQEAGENLIHCADKAMYEGKASGRNCYHFG